MKLYVLDVKVIDATAKFPLTIEGSSPLSKDGDWSVPDSAKNYFGQSSGYWRTYTDDDGIISIWLMEDEDPNMISFLWRSTPKGVGALDGILKFPLFLGETGTGLINPVRRSDYGIAWKVAERTF